MKTSIDSQEVAKFAQHSQVWWDKKGPLKTLHDINDTRLEFVAQHISLQGVHILDVGCGGGILSEALAKAGAIVTGLDAEPDAIATAKAHAKQENLTIDYHCALIEAFKLGPFDAITCMEMLEHVPDPALILANCHRLLKPGGKIFLSTLNRTAKAYAGAIVVAEYILNLLPRQTHDFAKFIKPSELANILRPLDMDIITLKGMEYNPLSRKASLTDDVSINYLMACGDLTATT